MQKITTNAVLFLKHRVKQDVLNFFAIVNYVEFTSKFIQIVLERKWFNIKCTNKSVTLFCIKRANAGLRLSIYLRKRKNRISQFTFEVK